MKKLYFISIALLILYSACSTEEDPKVETTREEMLAGFSSKSWALTYQETFVDNLKVAEAASLACDADNTFVFSADGSYQMKEGATKCETESPQEQIGTWLFNQDYSQLTIEIDNQQEVFKLISLESDKLVVELVTYWYTLRNTFEKR